MMRRTVMRRTVPTILVDLGLAGVAQPEGESQQRQRQVQRRHLQQQRMQQEPRSLLRRMPVAIVPLLRRTPGAMPRPRRLHRVAAAAVAVAVVFESVPRVETRGEVLSFASTLVSFHPRTHRCVPLVSAPSRPPILSRGMNQDPHSHLHCPRRILYPTMVIFDWMQDRSSQPRVAAISPRRITFVVSSTPVANHTQHRRVNLSHGC